jgi:hypothetical protein
VQPNFGLSIESESTPLVNQPDHNYLVRPEVRYKSHSIEEQDAVVERLREFLRVNYMTGSEAARRIGIGGRSFTRGCKATADQGLLSVSSPFQILCRWIEQASCRPATSTGSKELARNFLNRGVS